MRFDVCGIRYKSVRYAALLGGMCYAIILCELFILTDSSQSSFQQGAIRATMYTFTAAIGML